MLQPNLLEQIRTYPHRIIGEKCRRHFFTFVQEFWDIIIPEDPVWNWHIEYLCGELEKVVFRVMARLPKLYDLIINIPPGTTKSTVATQMLPAWAWIARLPRDKYHTTYQRKAQRRGLAANEIEITGMDLRFITGSYANDLSLDHAELSRDIIRSDKYRLYFPEISIKQDQDVKSHYKNTGYGSRFSTSVDSRATGMHAHIIVIDDPLNPNQALSDTDRESANHWLDATLSTRKVNKEITALILIMQRLHEDDPTGHMVKKILEEGKRIRHIRLPGEDTFEINPPELKEKYVDGLLDPVRLSRDVLDEMAIDLGPYHYAGQVGQDPRPREGGMFQKTWFEVVDAAPIGKFNVRGYDLAATETPKKGRGSKNKSSGPAFTAGVKMTWKDGVFYIEDVLRFRGSGRKVRTRMKNTATQDGHEVIIDFPQDPGQAGKSQAQDIAGELVGFDVRFSTESGDKAVRADPFSAQCEAGNVKLVKGSWNEAYLEELSLFPNGLFKDQVDASSRAFARISRLIKASVTGTVGAPGGVVEGVRNLKPEA